MGNRHERTEDERSVKSDRRVEEHRGGETIAHAARRLLRPLAADAEKALDRIARGKCREKRVHRLRATLRKMDVLLAALGSGFDSRETGALAACVRRARKAAGSVRDLDVVMGVLDRLAPRAAGGATKTDAVRAALQSRRDKAAKTLQKRCERERGQLKKTVRAMLGAPAGRRARLPARTAAVGALAREASAMREALRAGLRTPEHLHELRLNLKEARTVLDAMAGSLGPASAELGARSAALSDALGEVNDLATLATLLEGMAAASRGPRAPRDAAAALLAAVRRAHDARHREGVALARREVPPLVSAIRELSFGEEPAG